MPVGNEITALQEAKKLISELREQLQGANTDLLAISKLARESQGNFANIKLPKELQSSLQANQQLISQLNANAKERERLEKALERAIAKRTEAESNVNKEMIQHRMETNLINRALKDEAILSSKLVGAYQKLGVKHKQAARTLRDYVAEGRRAGETQKQFNKRLDRAQKEFDQLDGKIKKADRATKDFRRNVGNYSSAFGKASLAIRNFAGVFGVYSALQIGQEIFEQVKALDALNTALAKVSETQEEFVQDQQFLRSISELYGVELQSLIKDYTKFKAGLKGTNLEGAEGVAIFQKLVAVSANLSKSGEEVNGILKAVTQSISKGKIQAEELRGQLGDRLEGALNIMARALGVTNQELEKMLENGELMADEVLPKFADELTETFSVELNQRVETLVSEQNRLKNAWTEFILSLEGGQGVLSSVFKDLLTFVTAAVKGMSLLTKSGEEVEEFYNESTRIQAYSAELATLEAEAKSSGKSLKELARIGRGDLINSVNLSKSNIKSFSDELEELEEKRKKGLTGGFFSNDAKRIRELRDALEGEKRLLALRQGALDAVNSILKKNAKQTKENTDEQDNLNKAVKKLKELASISFGTTVQEAEKLRKEAEDIAKALEGTKLGDGETVEFGAIDVPDTDEITAALQAIADKYKVISKEAKISAETQREIFDQLFSTFSNYYGLDLTAFSKMIGQKEVALEDYANFAKSVSNAILESRLIRYENEIVANQERLDAILADEDASEEKKKQAQLEADRREKQLRTKQAKAERENVLIQIAIDTAAAVAKVLGQTGIVAPLVIPGIIALGLAQAAFVASQPLPKFKDGVENFEGGPAVINDQKGGKFKEIVETPDGKRYMSDKRNVIANLPKGTNVYSATDTERILAESEQERIDLAIMRMGFDMFGNLEGKIENGIEKGFKKARINNRIINKIEQRTTNFR